MDSQNKTALRGQAITDVVETHRGRLLSIIKAITRDQSEAEDILQDVFSEFIESYDLGQVLESVGAWLVAVAKNKTFDRFRRKKTQRDYQKQHQESSFGESNVQLGNDWMRQWFRDEIVEALEQLPEDQLEVFVLHELEGKSFEEIAEITGENVNTLLSRKRYAIQFLRDCLKEVYDELE